MRVVHLCSIRKSLKKQSWPGFKKKILSEENVRKYINLVLEQAQQSKPEPSADETAIELALQDVESKLKRWQETLEGGLLNLKDCAERIKELSGQREALLGRKVEVQKKSHAKARILPIPTRLMDEYVRQMQMRLRVKKSATERNFSEKF